MKSYRDLDIYKASYDLAIQVHNTSLKLPQYELYEEGGQLRRSSKGVPACIVEGYGRRKYKQEFIKFLTYAHASCDETIFHLNMLKDTHKNLSNVFDSLIKSYEELGTKIYKFIDYVEKNWNKNL